MRYSVACLWLCLSGCYIAHEPEGKSQGPSSPNGDPGAGAPSRPSAGEGPEDPGGGPPNSVDDIPPPGPQTDGGTFPNDQDGSDGETSNQPAGPRSESCAIRTESFDCDRADCDGRDDVALPAADIVASRGFIRGTEAVIQVLFAAQPFEVEATRSLEILFDRDDDPRTGQTGGTGDGRVWSFDEWVSVGRDLATASHGLSVSAVVASDLPLIEVRTPLAAISDSQTAFHYALMSPFGGSGGANEVVPDDENTYLTSRRIDDAKLCPDRGPYCDGPYVKRKSSDGCDAVHPSWTTYEDIATLTECFQLCADHPLCRESGFVNYNPQRKSCILDASCSPERVGYNEYVATGGCWAPQQCFSYRKVPTSENECWGAPSGYGYFEDLSIEACIAQCEKYPRSCGNFDRVDYDPASGDCMIERGRGCVERGLGFVEYVYEEVPCQ